MFEMEFLLALYYMNFHMCEHIHIIIQLRLLSCIHNYTDWTQEHSMNIYIQGLAG